MRLTVIIGNSSPTRSSSSSPEEAHPEKHYPHDVDDVAHIQYDEDIQVPSLAPGAEKKLTAKIDWRVVPVLTILYLLAFLDRVNIGNARLRQRPGTFALCMPSDTGRYFLTSSDCLY